MRQRAEQVQKLLEQLTGGDESVFAALFARHREQLRRGIARDLSADPRLAARFDASDVVQELFLDAQRQVSGYIENHERIEFLAWLRGLARERCLKFRRDHLLAQCRTLQRQHPLPDESWRHPAADQSSPSQAARIAERDEQLQKALGLLSTDD